jgi:hypothetical protein
MVGAVYLKTRSVTVNGLSIPGMHLVANLRKENNTRRIQFKFANLRAPVSVDLDDEFRLHRHLLTVYSRSRRWADLNTARRRNEATLTQSHELNICETAKRHASVIHRPLQSGADLNLKRMQAR